MDEKYQCECGWVGPEDECNFRIFHAPLDPPKVDRKWLICPECDAPINMVLVIRESEETR